MNQQALTAAPAPDDPTMGQNPQDTGSDPQALPTAVGTSPNASADVEVTLQSLTADVAELRTRVAQLEARLAGGEVGVTAAAAEAAVAAVAAPLAARPNDPKGEIKALLNVMFELALHADQDDRNVEQVQADFDKFCALVHHTRKGSPLLTQELFHYKWKPLIKRVQGYLSDPADPTSFTITQLAPDRIDARSETVRVFIRADKRMPPPLLLRRDAREDNAFRIDQSSL